MHHAQVLSRSLIAVARFTVASRLLHFNGELVLLVAAQVGVAHVEEGVGMHASRGNDKFQLDLGLLLQGQTLDGQQRVGVVVADYDPPTLLAFLDKEKICKIRLLFN